MTYKPSTLISHLTLCFPSTLAFLSFFHALSFLKHILSPVPGRLFSFIFLYAHLKNSQFKTHIPGKALSDFQAHGIIK